MKWGYAKIMITSEEKKARVMLFWIILLSFSLGFFFLYNMALMYEGKCVT